MKTQNFVIILVVILALVGGFVFLGNGDSGLEDSERNYDKIVNVDAFRFDFEPNEIRVEQGDRVLININNLDGFHGMRIPDLGISGNDKIEFVAGEKGEFVWYCNNYCGEGHGSMQGKLIIG